MAQTRNPEVAPPGFAGYTWTVTGITRDGQQTSVPARYEVALVFTPSGQFGASDPVSYHAGTYRPVGDGFTTSDLAVSAVGDGGRDPVALLAAGAMSAFGSGAHAAVKVSGDRMVISVGDYLITCRRDRVQLESELPGYAFASPRMRPRDAGREEMRRRGAAPSGRLARCAADDHDDHQSRLGPGLFAVQAPGQVAVV